MTPTDRAIEEIRKRRSVRTPILAALLDMEDAEVDALLAEPLGRGALIGCDVEVSGAKVKEYRCSVNGGGALNSIPYTGNTNRKKPDPVKARLAEWRQPKPSTPEASAGVALPAPSRPAAPRVVDSPEKTMSTIREKIEQALRTHGPMTTREMRKHGLKDPTLAQHCWDMEQRKLLKTVGGGARSKVYALPDQKATSVSSRSNEEEKKDTTGSPYASALADLRTKREAMARDLTKLDSAIATIEALG